MTDQNYNEANKLFARPEIQTYESEQQALLQTMSGSGLNGWPDKTPPTKIHLP